MLAQLHELWIFSRSPSSKMYMYIKKESQVKFLLMWLRHHMYRYEYIWCKSVIIHVLYSPFVSCIMITNNILLLSYFWALMTYLHHTGLKLGFTLIARHKRTALELIIYQAKHLKIFGSTFISEASHCSENA